MNFIVVAGSKNQIKISGTAKSLWMESNDYVMIPSTDNHQQGFSVTSTGSDLIIYSIYVIKTVFIFLTPL